MANSQVITNASKLAALVGVVASGNSVKAALYLSSASIGTGTGAYTATGEVSGAGYTAGGVAVTHATAPAISGTTAIWTPTANISFTGVTIGPTDCVLLYNVTRSNESMGSWTFGAQTLVAGDLILVMPVNDASNALLRI